MYYCCCCCSDDSMSVCISTSPQTCNPTTAKLIEKTCKPGDVGLHYPWEITQPPLCHVHGRPPPRGTGMSTCSAPRPMLLNSALNQHLEDLRSPSPTTKLNWNVNVLLNSALSWERTLKISRWNWNINDELGIWRCWTCPERIPRSSRLEKPFEARTPRA